MITFRRSTLVLIAAICFIAFGACKGRLARAQENEPFTNGQLVALVAGESLPESIVQDIGARALAFKASDSFRSQLLDAGADAKVLAAFDTA